MNITQSGPVRAVLAGCGGMSHVWIRTAAALPDRVQLVGLVDLNLANARRRADEFGLQDLPVSDRLEDLLRQTRPEAVFDCTIPEAHFGVTMTALKQGCHVLGEKPLADTMPRARRMVQAAAKAGLVYAVIQNRRYDANIRAVWQALQAGLIGRPHTFNADFYLAPHFGGFREQMRHVLILDMAIHSFDQARYLTGQNAVSVWCHEYNPPGSWYSHGASAMAVFAMNAGGVFNYRGSWCANGCPTSWQCAWRIIGETGTLLWDGESEIRVERTLSGEGFMRPAESIEVPAVPLAFSGHQGLMVDFCEAIRTGSQPMTAAADNIHSLAMVFAAIRSADTGRRIILKG